MGSVWWLLVVSLCVTVGSVRLASDTQNDSKQVSRCQRSASILNASNVSEMRLAAAETLRTQLLRAFERFGLPNSPQSNVSFHLNHTEEETISRILTVATKRYRQSQNLRSEQARVYIPLSLIDCGIDEADGDLFTCFSIDLQGVNFDSRQTGVLLFKTASKTTDSQPTPTHIPPPPQIEMEAESTLHRTWRLSHLNTDTDGWARFAVPPAVLRQSRNSRLRVTVGQPSVSISEAAGNESFSSYLELQLTRRSRNVARRKREVATGVDQGCSVRSVDVELGEIIGIPIWPSVIQFRYCSGQCSLLDAVSGASHANHMIRNTVAKLGGYLSSCCVPKSYQKITVAQLLSNNKFETLELDKVAAAECHCV